MVVGLPLVSFSVAYNCCNNYTNNNYSKNDADQSNGPGGKSLRCIFHRTYVEATGSEKHLSLKDNQYNMKALKADIQA